MDPISGGITALKLGVEAGKAIEDGINKQILNSDVGGGNINKPKEEMKESKTISFSDPNTEFRPNSYSRPMTSGTSSIDPRVDSNYDQKFNDLSMGTIDNTSVPENDAITNGSIFTKNV